MAMRPEGGVSAALARAVRRVVALALLAAMGCADGAADDDALCGGALRRAPRRRRRLRRDARNRSVRAVTGAPNVFVEDAPRNLFTANAFSGSFLHVVGASDQNRFVANPLSGEGARIDLESDVEQATGRERAPRGNLVQLGNVARTGPASLPCVILDGATGTVFDTVSLHCGDAPPAPGEEPAQVLVARDNPDPADPDVFHVADCDPDGPDLIVRLAPGVTVSPLVLEDRVCRAPAAARELP